MWFFNQHVVSAIFRPFKISKKQIFKRVLLRYKLKFQTYIRTLTLPNGVALATICGSIIAMVKGYQSWIITNHDHKEKEKEKRENTESHQRILAIERLQSPWLSPIIDKEMSCKVLYYVSRNEMLEELEKARTNLLDGKVIILVGSKGTGKSQLAYHAFHKKPGIIYCFLPSYVTRNSVDTVLLESTGFSQLALPKVDNPLQYLRRLLVDVKISNGYPVIIVEIERDSNENVVLSVLRSLKYLSSVARGIVIMTDPTNAIGITPDLDRRRFYWVSDFTEEQARQYLEGTGMRKKVEAEMTPEEREKYPLGTAKWEEYYQSKIRHVFQTVGTRPITLHSLNTDNLPIQQYIETQILSARNRINNLVIEHPQFLSILKDFMSSDTLKQEYVTKKLGYSLQKLIPILKGYQVITYDLEHEVFLLHSVSVKTAARDYILDHEGGHLDLMDRE